MPFIINALAALEIKTFMKRRDDNGLFVNVSASKPAHGRDEQDCAGEPRQHSLGGEAGAFLGLCLPTQFSPAYPV